MTSAELQSLCDNALARVARNINGNVRKAQAAIAFNALLVENRMHDDICLAAQRYLYARMRIELILKGAIK